MDTEELLASPVKLNIGGKIFLTEWRTLQRYPGSLLADLDTNSPYFRIKMGGFFFDQDPKVFSLVLNCYRTGKLHLSPNVCCEALEEELKFWKLDVHKILAPCCLGIFQEYEEKRKLMRKVYEDTIEENVRDRRIQEKISEAHGYRLARYNSWMFLERPSSSTAAQLWALLQILMVFLLMVIYALMTVAMEKIQKQNGNKTEKIDNTTQSGTLSSTILEYPAYYLRIVEIAINCFFTVDFLIRLSLAPSKPQFLKLVTTIVDLLCIVTFWAYMTVTVMSYTNFQLREYSKQVMNFVIIVQVFRLVKVTKLSSSSAQLRSLFLSLRNSLKEILVINICFLAVMFVFAVAAYYCEHRSTGSQMPHIPTAFWWALITMTTVGYGDAVPKTTAGYFVGGLCAMTGIILTGLAISILANNLNTYSQLTAQEQRAQRLFSKRLRQLRGQKNPSHAYLIPPNDKKICELQSTVLESETLQNDAAVSVSVSDSS